MPSQMPRHLFRNFDVYLDVNRVNLIGQASKLKLPELKMKTEEMRNAGMHFPIKVNLGYDKSVATLSMPGLDPLVMGLFGLAIGKETLLMATSAFADEDGTHHSGVFTGWGICTGHKIDDFEAGGKKLENSWEWAFRRWKWEYDGAEIISFDPFEIRINGVSQTREIDRALLRI